MKPVEIDDSSPMQRIFRMAHCNTRMYRGEELPTYRWDWPKNGFLTRRMAELAAREAQDAKAKTA